ncbi:hypothetical protein CEP51_007949 [Fusarium floridanum]|uniref:Uncharacterized protein n=1 Tax=Fusarium floridanum TaxID=1325733 RepID=A0A428RMI1_9HYPO|nr:hypothetical protein CEP51_007949 [Fusarium floridanum]
MNTIHEMMISYAIQAAVLLALGPFFFIAIILIDGQNNPIRYASSQSRSRWVNLVVKLGLSTHRANSFTAVCVLVSAVIRQDSKAPLFEARFTAILTFYQTAICALGSASYMLFCPTAWKIHWILQQMLYAVIMACACVQFTNSREREKLISASQERESEPQALFANIIKDCEHMKGYPPSILPTKNLDTRPLAAMIVFVLFVGLVTLTLILRLLYRENVRNIYRTFMRVPRHVRQAFNCCAPMWLSARPVGALCAAATFTAGISFGIIESYHTLQSIREQIRRYSKDEFEDNNWGFGQVLAVAVWVAWIADAAFLILEDILFHGHVQTRQARPNQDAELSDQTADRPQADHVQSSNPESQEQTTGFELTVK